MSRVQCDQCGEKYSLADEFSLDSEAEGDPNLNCRQCGAEVRLLSEPLTTEPGATPFSESSESTAALGDVFPNVSDESSLSAEVAGAGPPSDGSAPTDPSIFEASPSMPSASGTTPEASIEDTRPTDPQLEVAEPIELGGEAAVAFTDASAVISSDAGRKPHLPKAPARTQVPSEHPHDEDEEVPNSGTPSIASLVRRTTAATPEKRQDTDAFLDSTRYDRRPPDILIDAPESSLNTSDPAIRGSRTDAPVAGSRRPEGPSNKGASRWAPLAILLLATGGTFLAVLALRSGDAAVNEQPSESAPAALGALQQDEPLPPAIPAEAPEEPQAANEPEPVTPEPPAAEAAPRLPSSEERTANVPSGSAALTDSEVQAVKGQAPSEAAPALQAETPVAEAAIAAEPALAEFDVNAASLALDTFAAQAGQCRKADDPSGVAIVTITFAPSGRVTTATISGPPFAGTQTGGCIASTLRNARVSAFTGDFMTLKKTVAIP